MMKWILLVALVFGGVLAGGCDKTIKEPNTSFVGGAAR